MSDELWELGAEEIATAVRAGELRAADVVESCLARTASVEPSVAAYLRRFDDEARRRAAEVDRRRAAGAELGPLAGVPVALKDNLNLEGDDCTCASRILAGYRAPYTATAVERLLAAGAIPLGRTNMDEFAMGSSCENSAFQTTRNPWRLDAVPGGSSGGSAAAVAAGSVPLALGSDTGGSIRQPAALCGVVGLKPTYGRVSRYGLVAFASSLDQIGPLARSTRDAALSLAVIAGADPADSTCSRRPVDDYLDRSSGRWPACGPAWWPRSMPRRWRRRCATTGSARSIGCASSGCEIGEVSVPSLPAAIAVYYVIANCEASANLARFDGVRYGRRAKSASLLDLYLDSRERGLRPRGEAADHARHLRALLGLLRRLLRPGPRRAARARASVQRRLRRRRSHPDPDQPDAPRSRSARRSTIRSRCTSPTSSPPRPTSPGCRRWPCPRATTRGCRCRCSSSAGRSPRPTCCGSAAPSSA